MDPDAVDRLCSYSENRAGSEGDSSGGRGHDGSLPWRPNIAGRIAHEGAEDHWLIDFSTLANPNTPDGTAQAFQSSFSSSRRRPSDEYVEFRAVAARYMGCEPRKIIPTAGSMEAIRLTMATTVEPGDTVLIPAPTFNEYEREARLQGANPEFVPYDDLLDADPEPHTLAVVANPNNPTGTLYDESDLQSFVEHCNQNDTTVLLDETFLAFTTQPSFAGHEGTVVTRSLGTTFGLPGLRAGFAVASGNLRNRLDAARLTWSLNRPAMAVGMHCMSQDGFLTDTRRWVDDQRERLRTRLEEYVRVYPSDAPFLLLDLRSADRVDTLLDSARKHGIAIRDARTFRHLDAHVRVTVRNRTANDHLLELFAEAL